MNLYEKLNRLDDSLVESKRVVKEDKLTKSIEYDDDIDEQLYEGAHDKYELSELVKDSINHLVNDLGKDPMADDFADDVCADLENNYDIDIPQDMFKYMDWCSAVMSEVSRQLNDVEELTENRNNPYFAPYGYRDAAKVLNGKAPEYYYHLKEIEMDRGDGVKLARYAMRKGLPVMVDKNSDPEYPEFAIKGEYHWNDYFYSYPTAHEEDLVAWDGKMFVEEQLTEALKGPGYAIRAWENPESAKKGMPAFDSIKKQKLYPDFDAVIKALQSSELSELGAYEILWVKSGQEQ